jgi:IS30 family transposase
MAKTTNRLTEFEKAQIIAGYEAETPASMIAKMLGVMSNFLYFN